MMYYDFDLEQARKELKERYNRRFFIGAHIAAFIMSLIASSFLPGINIVMAAILATLMPHILYVAYHEYRHWVEKEVERTLYAPVQTQKRKRYANEYGVDDGTFRLTDDGEIQPTHTPTQTYRPPIREKKRRKDDSDEFDVKKLLKELKDVVD